MQTLDSQINAFFRAFNTILDVDEKYDFSLLDCVETDFSMEYKNVKVTTPDWTKYTFDGAYKYLLKYGLRNGPPSLNSEWMKVLVNAQIYGGVGTIDDMLSYSGYNVENILPSRKYNLVNFLQYYSLIQEVKRQRRGGRVFEITQFAEDLIDYVAQH